MAAPVALVVFTHPVPDSFGAAVRDEVVAGLERAGWEVDLDDLYGTAFDPMNPDPAVRRERVRRLRRARALVFVHPTWWGGPPAATLGWIEHVWALAPRLARRRIRRLVVVTTHGSSRVRNSLQGNPGRLIFMRYLRLGCHPRARSHWLAFYDNDRAGDEERRAFMDRVADRMSDLEPVGG